MNGSIPFIFFKGYEILSMDLYVSNFDSQNMKFCNIDKLVTLSKCNLWKKHFFHRVLLLPVKFIMLWIYTAIWLWPITVLYIYFTSYYTTMA